VASVSIVELRKSSMENNNETTKEMLVEWQDEREHNTLGQNIVALLGIHGVHCKIEGYTDASHITRAFEDLIATELEKQQTLTETQIRYLHAALQPDGFYDGKVSPEFKAGWQDALQWLMTMLTGKEVTKELEVIE